MNKLSSMLFTIVLGAGALVPLATYNIASAVQAESQRGGFCGGLRGAQCGAGLFCDFKPAVQCGAADQPGTCRKRPQFCAKLYRPVCGCDDKTYANDCERRAAGVGKILNRACGKNN
jgi:Kazal-type serine protease inhibitor domain